MIKVIGFDNECVSDFDFSNDELFSIDESEKEIVGDTVCYYICPDNILPDGSAELYEDKIETAEGYGYKVVNDIPNLEYVSITIKELLEKVEDMGDTLVLAIDDLTEWMIGDDSTAEDFEDMYSEAQVSILRDIIMMLVSISRKHFVSIRLSKYIYTYVTDIVHVRNLNIVETNNIN